MIRGPGIFLAQFCGDDAPFNTLPNLGRFGEGRRKSDLLR